MESKRKKVCPRLSNVHRSFQGVSCMMEEEDSCEGEGV